MFALTCLCPLCYRVKHYEIAIVCHFKSFGNFSGNSLCAHVPFTVPATSIELQRCILINMELAI